MSDPFLTLCVHAESKVGKTTLGASSPKPTLVLDSEAGGFRFVKGRILIWDPISEEVPTPGDWDICRVRINSTSDLQAAILAVKSGAHPFRSIVFDSITEYQTRLHREQGHVDQQAWGRILTALDDCVMALRDSVEAQDQLQSLLITAATEFRDDKFRPMLQGAMKRKLSFKLDVTGYLGTEYDDDGILRRYLQCVGTGRIDAGNRAGLPEKIWDPTITGILEMIK